MTRKSVEKPANPHAVFPTARRTPRIAKSPGAQTCVRRKIEKNAARSISGPHAVSWLSRSLAVAFGEVVADPGIAIREDDLLDHVGIAAG